MKTIKKSAAGAGNTYRTADFFTAQMLCGNPQAQALGNT